MDKKLKNKKIEHILWMDLEMTGLDTKEDKILEVAAIVTDWEFKEVATFEAAVFVDAEVAKKRMYEGPSKDFWEKFPGVRDALLAQNAEKGRPAEVVEDELLAFIKEHIPAEAPVLLGGNSIHMDRRFIENEWHRLDEKMHYRMLDVSAWKVVFEGKYGKKFAKPESHRALDDIRGSIEELQYYLGKSQL